MEDIICYFIERKMYLGRGDAASRPSPAPDPAGYFDARAVSDQVAYPELLNKLQHTV